MCRIPVIMCILFIAIMIPAKCLSLPGGESVTVIGEGSTSSSPPGQPPVYRYPGISFGMGDPSNYVVPIVKPKPTPPKPDGKSGQNVSYGTSVSPVMVFTMSSDVSGTGRFSTRSFMDGSEYDNNAYQLMSARYGNLTQSREVSFIKERRSGSLGSDEITYSLAQISIQDSMRFLGMSYTDLTRFRSDRDLIQEGIRTGAISRTSMYRSQSLDLQLEGDNYRHLMNNYTAYNIDTRFVGSSNLHVITNSSEIFESYIGRIAVKRDLGSQMKLNDTIYDVGMLECCAQLLPENTSGALLVSKRD
ncbi:hypothetical protein [Methanothrix thermoacetophila]|uniref:Uncharacterized protein n=1 Tax=Methanothrix thermoacetophila (strain DSM 6194 / JCM 14653 / NBRC 101360 / PT) TaxID=349307 RepID=A0B832_METTP|nr:hypothetical protein [Methanothrix thermoacetophila]ABK14856.1 hypothetical protein Mthe_1072 [Methanothrix thermoacetophila PT]